MSKLKISAISLLSVLLTQTAWASSRNYICVGVEKIAGKYDVEARTSATDEWHSIDYTLYQNEKSVQDFGFPPAYTKKPSEESGSIVVKGYRSMNPGIFSNSIAKISVALKSSGKKKFKSRMLREAKMEPKDAVSIYSGKLEIYDGTSFEGTSKLECIEMKNEE